LVSLDRSDPGAPATAGARSSEQAVLIAGVVALAIAGIVLRYGAFVFSTSKSGFMPYVESLCVWDCAWFKTVAETGYDLVPGMRLRPGAANWPFFPAIPAATWVLGTVTQLPATLVGFAFSTCCIVGAAVASRLWFGDNVRAYWLSVVMLLVGPFSFLFNTLYAEALFILMQVLIFQRLERGRYVEAGCYAAVLSATRVTGVLIVFAFVTQGVVEHLRHRRRWRDLPAALMGNSRLVLGTVIAPLGLFAFMAYLYWRTGDALAFAHIERAWNRELTNPLVVLWDSLTVPWPLSPDAMVIITWASGAVIGLLLCIVVAARGRWAAAVFCALVILLSLAGGITSLIRFVAGLFPLGMAVSETLAANRALFILAIIGAVIADAVLTVGWLRSTLFIM
jgi:hypothetical protein